MKIGLVQLNPVIGDFTQNVGRILSWIKKAAAAGCELVIFPELAISGYPPQDLLERHSFIMDHDAALSRLLVSAMPGIGVICGSIERRTESLGKHLYNSAVLFENGKILFTARKRLLPFYDVFDETRYFEPGEESRAFHYKGLCLGLTICEDMWNDKTFFPHRLYTADPVAELVGAYGDDLDLLINISASPYHIGKYMARQKMLANVCTKYNLPLAYVNQVGGQDSLLFDGRSLALDSNGEIMARAHDFVEDMVIFDTKTMQGEIRPSVQDAAGDETPAVCEALVMGTRDYVTKCGFKKGIVGLSGGIDSAVTVAIASKALGPENVLGVALPSPYTSMESIEDAQRLAANLGVQFATLPISEVFESYLTTLSALVDQRPHDIMEQNIQARIRGNLLMAMANRFGYLLLSTGNKSELAVGYCTLYGDMSGGLAVISDIPKELVYKIARHINQDAEVIPERILTRAPTAELKPDQRDQDDLPPYEVLDPILKAYLEDNLGIEEIVGLGFDRPVVKDVVNRIRRNEYKRKQAPLGLKVTTKAFGYGRRYPTAENYQENGNIAGS